MLLQITGDEDLGTAVLQNFTKYKH